MKKFLISVTTLLLVSGCATLKTPQINGTNRDEGLVDLSYSYGLFERPQVNWEQAELTTATQQCQSWGYQKPSANSEPWKECASTDSRGNCNSHIVTKRYQCGLSDQQIATVAKQKREELAKNYPYTAILKCAGNGVVLQIEDCFFSHENNYRTNIELMNGSEYSQGFTTTGFLDDDDPFQRVSRRTDNELIIDLRERFKVKVQNAGNRFTKLTLIVKKTATGEKTYEKSVTGFDSLTLVN